MNLDKAIEMSKELEKAYQEGWISLHSPVTKQLHLEDEKFKELAYGQKIYVEENSDEYDQHYFFYEGYKIMKLVEKEGDLNE